MKCSEITTIGLLGGLLFSTGVKAVVTDAKENPYNVIIERNVFGIKPPPPIVPPPPAVMPATEVKLAGITTILSPKRAILQWKEPAKPGTPPGKEESFIMVEGQREGIIEVVEIDEKAGRVKIKNAGEPMDIDFKNNGVKLASTPPPAVPGAPPGAALGATPVRPGAVAPPSPSAGLNQGVSTYNRFATGGNNPNPAAAGVNLANNSLPSIPTRQLRESPGIPTSVAEHQPPMTPETQIILMEVERERTKAQVAAGELPPLPPTELTPGSPEGQ
ncbi:MAG: hypothetical protein HY298_22150 [Verrucomicrobia bacterium]|nr:hypothetical protein [Verrucomicrobiota bacterium]